MSTQHNMMNKIGVMQGRLLPKYQGRYQAFPIGYWQEEFDIAKNLDLDLIEFILDFNDFKLNPLLTENGINEIKKLTSQSGVNIKTICADYFMEAPLHANNTRDSETSLDVLRMLINSSNKIGVNDIVIPCVDQSSLTSRKSKDLFIKAIDKISPSLEGANINLSLETDLPPDGFYDLLTSIESESVKVNYDIGNSASLGFNPKEELDAYGHKISDIHIKDRILGGGPVKLGEGDAKFEIFFDELSKYNYKGPFIMQAYRDEEGVKIFKEQLIFIKKFIN